MGGVNCLWADDYYNVTRYSQDYEDATTYATGWSGGQGWAQKEVDGSNAFYVNFNKNNTTSTYTLSFADNDYFKNAADYEFTFQFAFSHGNGNAKASTLSVKDTEGNVLFTFSNAGNYDTKSDIIYGETTVTDVYESPYNINSTASYATFTLTGNATNGVKLSVTGTTKSIYNNKKYTDCGVISTISNVKISEFAKIGSIELIATGGASHYFFDNMTLKEHSDVAVAEDPTFTFNRVSGENRVYTITNPNGEGTLYYTTATAESAPAVGDAAYSSTTENSIDVPFGTGTYYAYAVLADGTTTSAVVSQAVTGGAITLVKPYYSIVSYNESTAKTTITLNTNVSGLLGTPTATLKYTIDEGTEQSTTNGGSVEVADGSTISFYAEAEGYTTSETVEATATAPNTNPQLWKETYKGGGGSITLSSDAVVSVNGTDYKYMFEGETQISQRLLSSNTPTNFLYRSDGLYTGGGAYLAINNVKVGDYIEIEGKYGNGAFSITGNSTDLTADTWHTIEGTKYCFTVKRAGEARFTFNRYGYLKSITVRRALATPGATVSSTGYATFAADVALDLSTLTSGFTAYFASSAADGKVNMTKATDEKIAAGEGLFIQKTGDANTFTITETREATDDVDNYLVAGDGVTGGVTKEDGYDKYVLGADGGSVSFFLVNETAATVPANKAYLKLPAGDPSARLTISFGEETTGISFRNVETTGNERFYNLQGQPVAAPTKGLYIVRSAEGRLQGKNGKKVIVK